MAKVVVEMEKKNRGKVNKVFNYNQIQNILLNKKILFISTKNVDYIRITQEIELIKKYGAQYKVIAFSDKSYIKRVLKVYKAILFQEISAFDTIFVGFMPQLILPIWNWKIGGKEIIIDFFISVFDTLVDDRKKIKGTTLRAKVCKHIDEYTLKKADHIIVDTKTHGKYFVDDLNAVENKIEVLYLEADRSIFHEMNVVKPDEYKKKYVVCYFGSVLPVQGVEVILEAIQLLSDKKDIQFIMIGPISKSYRKPTLDTVTYVEWLSQDELAKVIAYSDLCLGGHFSGKVMKAKRTIPGKVYIYQAMNKPCILGDSAANRELFPYESEKYFWVELGEPKTLAERIVEIYERYRRPAMKSQP